MISLSQSTRPGGVEPVRWDNGTGVALATRTATAVLDTATRNVTPSILSIIWYALVGSSEKAVSEEMRPPGPAVLASLEIQAKATPELLVRRHFSGPDLRLASPSGSATTREHFIDSTLRLCEHIELR